MKIIPLFISLLLCLTTSVSEAMINNSSLIPPFKPDDKVKLEGISPDWVKTLVMAELRIETATANGTFNSAVKALDHYAEMGVNGLWICPVYKRPGAIGYTSFGPHLIDDNIAGTNNQTDAFCRAKKFVDEAHKRNIRIFFDIVIWGTAKNSPLVKEHPEFYKKEKNKIKEIWGGYSYDHNNKKWQKWFITQATNLIISTGADGFRCDLEPAISGYKLWAEVRRLCYAVGRKIVIISELHNKRSGVYDFQQNGVGYIKKSDWEKFRESGYFYISNNIVDSVKTGVGIGIPETEQGRGRFYTYNISNHDSYNPVVNTNIIVIGYQAIFAPFIPMWYIGEEWGNHKTTDSVLYFNKIFWKEKKENSRFFEKVKKLIGIRRQYPDIFNYYPPNHRDANICKVDVQGNKLQSYARFRNGEAILVIPNNSETNVVFKVKPPYKEMGMSGIKNVEITDLLSGKIIFTNANKLTKIKINVPANDLSVILLKNEKN